MAVATRKLGVLLFDPAGGSLIDTLEFPGDTRAVNFSPDGRLLAASGYSRRRQGQLRIWEEDESGYAILHQRFDRSGVRTEFQFSPDNQHLAVWSGTSPVRLLDVTDLHEAAAYPAHQYTTHATFGPDSRYLFTAGSEGAVRVWDRSSEIRFNLPRRDNAYATDFAVRPDGNQVALVCDRNPFRRGRSYSNAVEVMDVNQWRRALTLRGHSGAVTSVDYDAAGSWLVTGSDDQTLRVWDADSGSVVRVIQGHTSPVVGVHCDQRQDAAVVSINRAGLVLLHGGPAFEETARYESGLSDVTHSALSDGRLFAVTSGGSVARVELSGGRSQTIISCEVPLHCVDVSPSGRLLTLAPEDGSVRLVDLSDPTSPDLKWNRLLHRGPVYSVAFHGRGDRVVTTGDDGFVRVVDAESGQELLPLKTATFPGPVYRARFAPRTDRLLTTTRAILYAWESRSEAPPDANDEAVRAESWHRSLAKACESAENPRGAIRHWQCVARLDPQDVECHLRLAECHHRREHWELTEEAYRAAVRTAEARNDGDVPKLLRARAYAALASFLATCPDKSRRSGREAISYASRALTIAPGDRHYLQALSDALREVARRR